MTLISHKSPTIILYRSLLLQVHQPIFAFIMSFYILILKYLPIEKRTDDSRAVGTFFSGQ